MRGEVFLDAGAFIAFLDRSDGRHELVKTLFATPPPRWSTSLLVVAETYGWFLHRLGEEAARTFRRLLDTLPGLVLLDADAAHHAATEQVLDRLRGSRLTYVDASSLAHLRARGIRTVWSTDHHLGLEGAQVVPGGA